MPSFYGDVDVPKIHDTMLVVAQKTLGAIIAGGGGGGGTSTGVVDPGGSVTAAAGSLYYNSANDTLWVNTDGGTTWSQLI